MTSKMAVWLAPMLTIALLAAHETIGPKDDYTAAAKQVYDSSLQQEQAGTPVLAILEAYDMLGNRVTVKGTVTADPTPQADGSLAVPVRDGTGSLMLYVAEGAFHMGDLLQATGIIGGTREAAVLKAEIADVRVIR